MSLNNILPVTLKKAEHIKAFDDTFAYRLSLLPLENITVNLIDTLPENVLIWLADQLDVMGLKGWQLTTNTTERVALLKNAIIVKSKNGTVGALRRAIQSLGFPDVTIYEGNASGNALLCNGVAYCDGTFDCGGGGFGNNWATFSVVFDLGNYKGISTASLLNLRGTITEYKNERSHLLNIDFVANLTEENEGSESFISELTTDQTDDFTDNNGLLCNGYYICNGFRLCASNNDDMSLTIYN